MDPESGRNSFLLRLLVVNFLFAASFLTGKSIFYLFADFAFFAFIFTLLYVNIGSFLEKKKLAQSEQQVVYVQRASIAEPIDRIVRAVGDFLTAITGTTTKQSLIVRAYVMQLVGVLVIAAAFLHVLPTLLVLWIASLAFLLNEEAPHNQRIGELKKNLLNRVDPLLAGFKKEQ